MTFGEYLWATMQDAGYDSNAALARDADVNKGSVSRWRNGVEQPSVEALRRIAPVLNVPLRELIVRAGIMTWDEVGYDGPLETPKPRTFEARLAELEMSNEAREVVMREFERMQRLRDGRRSVRRDDDGAEDARRSA